MSFETWTHYVQHEMPDALLFPYVIETPHRYAMYLGATDKTFFTGYVPCAEITPDIVRNARATNKRISFLQNSNASFSLRIPLAHDFMERTHKQLRYLHPKILHYTKVKFSYKGALIGEKIAKAIGNYLVDQKIVKNLAGETYIVPGLFPVTDVVSIVVSQKGLQVGGNILTQKENIADARWRVHLTPEERFDLENKIATAYLFNFCQVMFKSVLLQKMIFDRDESIPVQPEGEQELLFEIDVDSPYFQQFRGI